jgi:glycosyltransferase involved in cell wall biosynthesis
MPPHFTVLLPVHRPPVMLPFAIESVLAQNVPDFELFVVCDGAPEETAACAREYAVRDQRLNVLVFPKGEGHGEAYRHVALSKATGRYVAHICDDDLWFPNHLEEMRILLSTADFGNLLHVSVRPDGRIEVLPGDIGLPETRHRMLTKRFNLFSPTFAGYRIEAYRRLPEGWAPGPPDVWTDLHMWRKFLRIEGFAFATRGAITALNFATPERADLTPDERHEENRAALERIRDPRGRDEIIQAAWRSLSQRALRYEEQVLALTERDAEHNRILQAEINRMLQSRSWRLTAPLRALRSLLTRSTGP